MDLPLAQIPQPRGACSPLEPHTRATHGVRPLDAALLSNALLTPRPAPQPPPPLYSRTRARSLSPDPDPNPNQGPPPLELDDIAPNYALRKIMEEWIAAQHAPPASDQPRAGDQTPGPAD